MCYSYVETLDHLMVLWSLTQYMCLEVRNLLHISQLSNYQYVDRYGKNGAKEYLKVRKTWLGG